MSKTSKRVPPALKHGIFSGLGVLPTESRAKFRKFKKQRFADLGISGPSEVDIGDQIVRVEWRLKNLFTYDLAKRAGEWDSSIYSKWVPSQWDLPPLLQETHSPEELAALRKRAQREIRAKLGSAIELLQIRDVVTYDHLEKELAIREKLEVMITRLYKKISLCASDQINGTPQPASTVPAAPGKRRMRLETLRSRAAAKAARPAAAGSEIRRARRLCESAPQLAVAGQGVASKSSSLYELESRCSPVSYLKLFVFSCGFGCQTRSFS